MVQSGERWLRNRDSKCMPLSLPHGAQAISAHRLATAILLMLQDVVVDIGLLPTTAVLLQMLQGQ